MPREQGAAYTGDRPTLTGEMNMKVFKEWKAAHTEAVNIARLLGHDVGLLKAKEYDKDVFQVFPLPKPQNRAGFELRCEVVGPTDPI
jgi:hypothetical protein